MNIIKTKVDFTKGTCTVSGINLVEGDYNSTKIEFTFDREDGTKVFEMKSPSEQLVAYQEIYNNEIILYGLKDVTTEHNSKTYTKYTKNDAIYWYQPTDNKLFTDAWVEVVTFDLTEYTKATEKASIFTEEGNYIFEISLYEDDSKLTSASGKIKVKAEQVKIDDNMVTPYIPIFDELMQDVETALGNIEDKITEVNTAITQTNNLDLDVSKSGKVATVTLTKKDNTTKTVTLSDGTSLMFQWDGTKLGIKTDNDESYTYVDLKGETGETGATPSLSIGTVSTGSPSAVTITGTDENPVLNFTLEKGETGATGATGNGIASITKISSVDTTDTYRITFTDGTTYDYEITNGEVSQAQLDELQAEVDRYKLLENALPHVTGSGESVTLNNTANAGMTIDLEPNTSQESTPTPDYPQDIHVVSGDNTLKVGNKNLFNKSTIESGKEISNGTIYNNSSWCISDYIVVEYNQTYIKNINNGNDCIIYDKDKNKISTNDRKFASNKITITEQNAKYIRVNLPLTSLDTYQLEVGNTATTYEPHEEQIVQLNLGDLEYCKIPNSDYKDEFMKPSGKNILPSTLTTQTLNGIEITKNNDGSYTLNGTCSANVDIKWFEGSLTLKAGTYYIGLITTTEQFNLYYKVGGQNIVLGTPIRSSYYELVLTEDTTITNINSWITANKVINNATFYPMICKVLPFEYEPYNDGKWYLKSYKDEGQINTDEFILFNNSYTNLNTVSIPKNSNDIKNGNVSRNIPIFCNKAIYSTRPSGDYDDESLIGKIYDSGNVTYFIGLPKTITTFEEAKTYLGNITYWFVRKTPQYIPLNNTLQEALNTLESKLLAYKGQTNISQVNDDLPFEIVASALKDISNL